MLATAASSAPLMLGISGLRGILGASLSAELALRYAASIGDLVRERAPVRAGQRARVVLARDGRAGADAIHAAALAGLLESGCDVLDIGVAMTPTAGVMTDAAGAAAGVIITASHNPQEWSGIKLLLRAARRPAGAVDAAAPPAEAADALIRRFQAMTAREPSAWDRLGSVRETHMEAAGAHFSLVRGTLTDLGFARAIKRAGASVLLDCVGGAGRVLTPNALERLGVRVRAVGVDGDGRFTHTPEPTEANLRGVAAQVKRARTDVGFAQDPDADRLAVIDGAGRYIGEEYTLALAAMALREAGLLTRGSRIAVNLSTSRMVDDVAASCGARVIRTPVGEANVVAALKSERCVLAGEGNGGVILPTVTCVRDSLTAIGLVLGLMARTGRSVRELAGELPAYAIEKRKVELARREDAREAGERVAAAFAPAAIDRQDGVRIDLPDERAWLHVRASNTEPIMRLIAEAPDAHTATALLDRASRLVAPPP